MTKIDALCRFLFPCYARSAVNPDSSAPPSAKKRLSTSLRDDIDEGSSDMCHQSTLHPQPQIIQERPYHPNPSSSTSSDDDGGFNLKPSSSSHAHAPPRWSKSMVTGTIFGLRRRGNVWFCVQHDRTTKPSLLLEISMPVHALVKEMGFGLVRIALECDACNPELVDGPLRSVPEWTASCNGRNVGRALRRRTTETVRHLLKTTQSITVGAGVIKLPHEDDGERAGELMYMRANYECVTGGADSESFHLINPDDCSGQELSLFLIRSR